VIELQPAAANLPPQERDGIVPAPAERNEPIPDRGVLEPAGRQGRRQQARLAPARQHPLLQIDGSGVRRQAAFEARTVDRCQGPGQPSHRRSFLLGQQGRRESRKGQRERLVQ